MDSKVWIIGGLVLILALGGAIFYFGGYAGETAGQFTKIATVKYSSCTDTDGGMNFDVAGTVTLKKVSSKPGEKPLSYSDVCEVITSKGVKYNLKELYCGSDKSLQSKPYACPNGCKGGVCVAAPAVCGNGVKEGAEFCDDGNNVNGDACSNCECSDSDGGTNYGVKGSAAYSLVPNGHEDNCPPGREANIIEEYSCELDEGIFKTTGTTIACPSGQVCRDGACVAATTIPEAVCGNGKVESDEVCDDGNDVSEDACSNCACSDSDGGNNYDVKGTSADLNNPGGLTDECQPGLGEGGIREFFCQVVIAMSDGSCPSGKICSDGACVAAPAVCGNGVKEAGEVCDDGNSDSTTCQSCLCSDTDGGKNYDVKGTVSDGVSSVTDVCTSGTSFTEYHCDTSNPGSPITSGPVACTLGYVCQDAVCVKSN